MRQAEHRVLTRPFCWRISQANDPNPARQSAINCGPHEIGCEESQRYSHVDLPHAAPLSPGDAFYIRRWVSAELIEPTSPSRDRCDQGRASLRSDWSGMLRLNRVRQQNFATFL